jgi:hypothetical protein
LPAYSFAFRSDDRGFFGPNGPMGPAFSDDLMRSLIATLYQDDPLEPSEHDLIRWQAALTLLEAFQPRTAIEAMLAAQAVAAHNSIMECHHRAMRGELPETVAARVRTNAVALIRGMEVILKILEQRQAKPLPPPLPPVPQPEGADAPTRWEDPMHREEVIAAAEAMASGEAPPRPMRPAVVVPSLHQSTPMDKEFQERTLAMVHAALNEQLDRERGGTPQEWYARQREEVRQREARDTPSEEQMAGDGAAKGQAAGSDGESGSAPPAIIDE